jgi:urease accessory protein
MRIRITALAALLFAAAPAFAHEGHQAMGTGFGAGALHPFLGLDHLLVMTVIGIWAAQLGGRARWAVLASFLLLMAVGAGLALGGFAPPGIEAGVAASLVVLGLLVAAAGRLPLPAAMVLAGSFALYHGAAHGSELPVLATPAAYALGFLASTASLHALGIGIGSWSARRSRTLARMAGLITAAAGLAYSLG